MHGEAQVEKARARSRPLSVAATRAGIAFALAALTLTVFVQIRHHDFVDYDDYVYVAHNPHVKSGSSWQSVKEAFTTPYRSQWTPLSRISLQLSYELHGPDATGYLLTNVALHLLSTLLLFFALACMSGAVWCSAFVAAVFAVHPLHVESVAWASARKDVLSALFCMLTFAAYARYAARPASKAGYALVLMWFVNYPAYQSSRYIGLALQGLLFQYGGLTSLGVNTLNMALPAVLCHYLFGWGVRVRAKMPIFTLSAFACGFCAVLGSVVLLGFSLYLTGEAFLPAAKVAVAANLPIMLIEGMLTASCALFLRRVKPELLEGEYAPRS